MKCPFLKESRVRSCRVSPIRKQIPGGMIHEDEQRCSSKSYRDCPAAQGHLTGEEVGDRCPFLQESLVQYCEAASVRKFIPYNDDTFSRCNSDAHTYCQLYLQRTHPGGGAPDDPVALADDRSYSRNHMWMDLAADGTWHVGIDAFAARVLGPVAPPCFVSTIGRGRPTVVLTAGGVDLSLAFPCRLDISGCNAALRSRPEALTADPYGAGWLYEGQFADPAKVEALVGAGLLQGEKAASWMRRDVTRVNEFVHEVASRPRNGEEVLAADGGSFAPNLAGQLEREELLRLFNLFFAPHID